jgi:hypothetical protein
MTTVRAALVSLVIAWPEVAAACGVCMSAQDGTREAYYGTTVLLILVPAIALGAIGWWLSRAAKRRQI